MNLQINGRDIAMLRIIYSIEVTMIYVIFIYKPSSALGKTLFLLIMFLSTFNCLSCTINCVHSFIHSFTHDGNHFLRALSTEY